MKKYAQSHIGGGDLCDQDVEIDEVTPSEDDHH